MLIVGSKDLCHEDIRSLKMDFQEAGYLLRVLLDAMLEYEDEYGKRAGMYHELLRSKLTAQERGLLLRIANEVENW